MVLKQNVVFRAGLILFVTASTLGGAYWGYHRLLRAEILPGAKIRELKTDPTLVSLQKSTDDRHQIQLANSERSLSRHGIQLTESERAALAAVSTH